MSLRILYVEDIERDVNTLQQALDASNKGLRDWSKILLINVPHPSQLPAALPQYADVVLADVFFPVLGGSSSETDTDQLGDIIRHVREWDQKSPHGFPTPVIAYTSRGPLALQKCLAYRESLYDIWDKLGAGAEYVAWRFQRLAAELPRYRPDATIQKLVAAMPAASCPEWHPHVLSLIKNYGQGQTESEQVWKCRDSLQKILDTICPENVTALMALWDAFVRSEPLLRAASPKLRGIARHSINVFWLGYWLINNPILESRMRALWTGMVDRRSEAHELRKKDPLAGLNAVWLLASFFHDAGRFHENGKAVIEAVGTFFSEFNSLSLVLCLISSFTKSFDFVENGMRGRRPGKGFRVAVMVI